MFERYTEGARRVLFFARYEVSDLGGASIQPEHVLLGLLREAKGIIDGIVAHSNISTEDLSRQLRDQLRGGATVPKSEEIPISQTAKRALDFAAEEADRLLHSDIGVEHLLLGLLREERSPAATMLIAHGMSLDRARAHIAKMVHESPRFSSGEARVAVGLMHIERIRQLVDELAKAQPNSGAAQNLQERISKELMALRTLLE